jgi:hypothetical protein
MQRQHFTQEEAKSKVGRTIESLVPFSGVPRGTTGKVVAASGEMSDGWDVVIEWDLPCRLFGVHHRALRDWFIRSEYYEYLREI